MSNPIDTNSALAIAALVTFEWGDSSITRYTSWTDDLIVAGDTFTSLPKMDVNLGQQHGGSDDVPATLTMSIVPPLDTLTVQPAHAKVTCTIEEIEPTVGASTRRMLFKGEVTQSTCNPDGRSGLVELQISGWKLALGTSMNGWAASTYCNNTFGDQVCRIDLASIQETATITAINGNKVTLSGLTTTATLNYWRAGYITFDGLSILVRDYGTGAVLELLKAPPASWMGKTVTVTPGCDKLHATCKGRWRNETHFTGFGIGMPAYNPLLESP